LIATGQTVQPSSNAPWTPLKIRKLPYKFIENRNGKRSQQVQDQRIKNLFLK